MLRYLCRFFLVPIICIIEPLKLSMMQNGIFLIFYSFFWFPSTSLFTAARAILLQVTSIIRFTDDNSSIQ